MPRNPYPGRKLQNSLNYFETKVSFDKIVHNIKLQNLIKPDYQGSLSEDRVDSMVKEYISKPSFFYFKNRIVIGDLNDSWYIVDGQHRLDMCKKLSANNTSSTPFKVSKFFTNSFSILLKSFF